MLMGRITKIAMHKHILSSKKKVVLYFRSETKPVLKLHKRTTYSTNTGLDVQIANLM